MRHKQMQEQDRSKTISMRKGLSLAYRILSVFFMYAALQFVFFCCISGWYFDSNAEAAGAIGKFTFVEGSVDVLRGADCLAYLSGKATLYLPGT